MRVQPLDSSKLNLAKIRILASQNCEMKYPTPHELKANFYTSCLFFLTRNGEPCVRGRTPKGLTPKRLT